MALSKSEVDRTRFLKMTMVILEEVTPLLQHILYDQISPQQILSQVTRHHTVFKSLRAEQLMFVQNAKTDGYTKFDITLLYTLLRNLKCVKVTAPSHGWGTSQMPGTGDTTLGDDIERIRLIRNKVLGHTANPSMSEKEYRETISIIAMICKRMDKLLNTANNKFANRLVVAEIRALDKEIEDTYLEKINDLCAAEKTTREMVQEIISNTGKI
jgi:hypothetical protein